MFGRQRYDNLVGGGSTVRCSFRQVRRLPLLCWRNFHSPTPKYFKTGIFDGDGDRISPPDSDSSTFNLAARLASEVKSGTFTGMLTSFRIALPNPSVCQ